MNNIFSDVNKIMDALCEPLGECVPRRRRLVADYKDETGRDLHQEVMTWHDRRATDAALVESIQKEFSGIGCKLTALAECPENGPGRVLYLAPGYLEEFAVEMGLPIPEDIAATLGAAGVRPVNWEELTHGG